MNAAEVRKLRAELRWTQDEMAAYLGCNRSSVSRYEDNLAPRGAVLKLLVKLAEDVAKGRRRPKGRNVRKRHPSREAVAQVG